MKVLFVGLGGVGQKHLRNLREIDDSIAIRELLRKPLADAGLTVVEAANGDIGLETLRNLAVEVVVTDLLMPGKEGLETIGDIREIYGEQIKIIAMSSMSEYLEVARELGADQTIVKPFKVHKVLELVVDFCPAARRAHKDSA